MRRRAGDEQDVIRRKLTVAGSAVHGIDDLAETDPELQPTVDRLVADDRQYDFTIEQVQQVHDYLENGTRTDDREVKLAIVRLVTAGTFPGSHKDDPKALQVFHDDKVMEKLGMLGQFLGGSSMKDALDAQGTTFNIRSNKAGGMGDAALINNVIHLGDNVLALPARQFMRTAVHETGHAVFQRMLVDMSQWDDETDAGAKAPVDDALEVDGERFYAAWKVLRQPPKATDEQGRPIDHLLITKVSVDRAEGYGEGRRNYIAGKFREFCAESFMHVALEREKLDRFIESLRNQPTMPTEIVRAWEVVMDILDRYDRLIIGNRAWENADDVEGDGQ